jgi:hypothetical protein
MHDMAEKGRKWSAAGSQHPRARLSDEDVDEIRRRRAMGDSQAAIALDFGISGAHVGGLISGKSWGRNPYPRPVHRHNAIDAEEVVRLYAIYGSVAAVARAVDRSPHGVSYVLRKRGAIKTKRQPQAMKEAN